MILLLGSGNLAKEIAMVFDGPFTFVDHTSQADSWQGIPILKDMEEAARTVATQFVPGVGDPRIKKTLVDRALALGLSPAPALIHPQAYVHRTAEIAPGAVIYPTTAVSHSVVVEEFAVVNLQCSIGHDARIGRLSTLSPAVAISGHVTVGEGSYIGTGAAVREKVSIGAWSQLSMGAILLEDLPPETNAFYFARLMKSRAAPEADPR